MGNEIVKDPYSQLTELIPRENLDFYLAVYEEMRKISFNRIGKKYPHKIISDVRENILKLQKSGWLDKDNADELIEDFNMSIFCCNDGKNQREIVAKTIMVKRGAPIDHALAFLVFAIIYDLRYFHKRPRFNLVLSFLHSYKIQNKIRILPESSLPDVDSLKKRYKQFNITETIKSFYYSSFVSEEINRLYGNLCAGHVKNSNEGFRKNLVENVILQMNKR